jgi:serpin B
VRLAIANSIWGQRSLAFGKPFLDTLAIDYGSEIRGVDFIGASTQATNAINGWVADQTAGKIQDLFAPGSLGADTRVVLVNAIYFDADWQTKFDASKTAPAPFTKLDGATVSAQMMNLDSLDASLAIAPTYTAIDLPYAGGQTSMLVILPSGGQFASVEAALGGEFLANVVSSLQPASGVSLSLPKFTLAGQSISLNAALQALGMNDAFIDGKADFSPMSTSEPLHIDQVVHQAYVRVDENGTEAAAATGVGIGDLAIAENSVNVNRPFFFVLRDVPTGAVLFVGRVMDPTLNGN